MIQKERRSFGFNLEQKLLIFLSNGFLAPPDRPQFRTDSDASVVREILSQQVGPAYRASHRIALPRSPDAFWNRSAVACADAASALAAST